mgnify:CR=1 FL=1
MLVTTNRWYLEAVKMFSAGLGLVLGGALALLMV